MCFFIGIAIILQYRYCTAARYLKGSIVIPRYTTKPSRLPWLQTQCLSFQPAVWHVPECDLLHARRYEMNPCRRKVLAVGTRYHLILINSSFLFPKIATNAIPVFIISNQFPQSTAEYLSSRRFLARIPGKGLSQSRVCHPNILAFYAPLNDVTNACILY